MRKPQFASKKAVSATGWWKHARPFGKRMVNKSERRGFKKQLNKNMPYPIVQVKTKTPGKFLK